MSSTLSDLLAMDGLASKHGCALNPRLKQAIEADLRFPAKAASPQLQHPLPTEAFPDNVMPLATPGRKQQRKQA